MVSEEYITELFDEVCFENHMMILTKYKDSHLLYRRRCDTIEAFNKLTHVPERGTPRYYNLWMRLIAHSSVAIKWVDGPTEEMVGLHKASWEI